MPLADDAAAETGNTRPRPGFFRYLSKMRRVGLLLWPHAREHKPLLAGGALFSLGLLILRLLQPWPIKWVVDALSGASGRLPGWADFSGHYAVALFCALYILIAVLAARAEYWQQLLLTGLGNKVLFSFRNRLFGHVLSQPVSFHEKKGAGEILTRVVYDTSRLRRGVNGILTRTIQVALTFLAVVTMLVWLNWRLAAVLGLCGGAVLAVMNSGGIKLFKAARRQRKREGQLADIVAEALHAIRELQVFRVTGMSEERFGGRNEKSLGQENKVRTIAASLLFRTEALLSAGIFLTLLLGAGYVDQGALSLGTLVLFLHYAAGLSTPFRQFAVQAAQTGRTLACADRLAKIMEKEPAVADIPGAAPAPVFRGEIRLEGVYYKASNNRKSGRKWLLDNVAFMVRPGERVVVMGPNGAGKSTLLRLMLRLADPHGGGLAIDGHDLREYSLESFRRQLSVVFQESVFPGRTIRENIAIGRPDAPLEDIRAAAQRCGLTPWVEKMLKGYDTGVRRQGKLFSGGERQKIALARALLRDGRIWLLDEPTSGLDAKAGDELTELLLEVTRGKTTLWITHDVRVLHWCDKVILLGEGQLRFFGTPHEFGLWLESENSTPGITGMGGYLAKLKGIK